MKYDMLKNVILLFFRHVCKYNAMFTNVYTESGTNAIFTSK